jgi:hypothetical protein
MEKEPTVTEFIRNSEMQLAQPQAKVTFAQWKAAKSLEEKEALLRPKPEPDPPVEPEVRGDCGLFDNLRRIEKENS